MNSDSLRREIAASRAAIGRDYTALCEELDFGAKARRAVVEHPLPWLGGAAFLGYLLSPARRARREKHRQGRDSSGIEKSAKKVTFLGVGIAAARILFPLARPALTAFALRKLSGLATRFQ